MDIVQMALSQGALGIGPIEKPEDILPAVRQGIAAACSLALCDRYEGFAGV